LRIKRLQLGIVEIDLGRRVVVIIQKLASLYPVKWVNPLEGELDLGVHELHLLEAAGKGHISAIGDQATLLINLSLQLVIVSLQQRLIR
jgi:hypothetical protein